MAPFLAHPVYHVPTRLEHELLFHSVFVCKSSTRLGVQFATEPKTLCGIIDTSTFFRFQLLNKFVNNNSKKNINSDSGLSLTVKEFWKSVDISRSYGQKYNVLFFWLTVVSYTDAHVCNLWLSWVELMLYRVAWWSAIRIAASWMIGNWRGRQWFD